MANNLTANKSESKPPISIEDYEYSLIELCHRDTSLDPHGWTEDDYLHGHGAVVSLQAQKLFGGTLLRASLENTPYASMRSHYKNKFSNEQIKDFTAGQFNEGYPNVIFEHRDRKDILNPRHINTLDRYVEFTFRLNDLITSKKNSLFADDFYRQCISQAVLSPCQKAGFGAIIVQDDKIVSAAYNTTIDELAGQCDPRCIRLGIQSRTESMIGACGHAEEFSMMRAKDNGFDLSKCDIYIAGIDKFGIPLIKSSPEHSCLRCAVQMNYNHLNGVYVPVNDKWEKISISEALKTAEKYALKEKKV